MRRQLLAALASLRCGDRIRKTAADEVTAREIARMVAQAMAPVVVTDDNSPSKDEDLPAGKPSAFFASAQRAHTRLTVRLPVFNEDLKKARDQLVRHCRAVSSLGVQVFEALVNQSTQARLDDDVLLTLVALADGRAQDWADPETAALAGRILESEFVATNGPAKEDFITETVLQRYLRPLFSRSKPSSITASGRKAEYTDSSAPSRGQSMPDDSAQTKPWKYIDLRAVPAVAWAVNEADVRFLRSFSYSRPG